VAKRRRTPNSEQFIKGLLRDGSESFRRKNPSIEDILAGAQDTKQKHNERLALVEERKSPEGMVDVPDKVSVRIIRYIPDKRSIQDDDNTNGGCKELRDAIAALLCREGDSEVDGFVSWDIETRFGPFAVEIEIYEEE
jgi:hypothetical protein